METAEFLAVTAPEGLALLDEVGPITSDADAAHTVSQLRRSGHSPELVAAVVTQARLRAQARAKFGERAQRMLFTRAGLEQATRMSVATQHAARVRAAGIARIADLGCGIGGDALGFATAGLQVTAVDADEVTAQIAAHNLAEFGAESGAQFGAQSGAEFGAQFGGQFGGQSGAQFGAAVTVQHGTAEASDLSGVDAVWLDPARRTAGHGETSRVRADEYTPPLLWVFALAERMPAGIKLGPGFDRGRIPDALEAQWISVDGSTVELVLWSGRLAREGVRRAALVLRGGDAHELTAPADAADEPVRELGAFVHEPEGAVIRARLIGEVARTLQAGMLAPKIAYLTGDAALTSPFARSFRVREVLPAETKPLARALRERGIGRLEIKKRGVDVDPAALRTRLKLRGEASATLIVTRAGARRVAILCDRVEPASPQRRQHSG